MRTPARYSRRAALKQLARTGVCSFLATGAAGSLVGATNPRRLTTSRPATEKEIVRRVMETPMVDSHEHLPDESVALSAKERGSVWSALFSHYLDSDLLVAGMPKSDLDRFLDRGLDAHAKWSLIEPYWPAVKNTGYAQAVRLAIRELYGISEVSASTVTRIEEAHHALRKPGYYRKILQERTGLECCQVNALEQPFRETEDPTFLMQDISIVGMFSGPNVQQFAGRAGRTVKSLQDWHQVIDWWFDRYGKYAVAVKSQNAYSRDIDYAQVPPEQAEPVFSKALQKDPVFSEERKLLEDHLFWYAVNRATKQGLPIKIHTGYYAGQNSMPLKRVRENAASAAQLCRLSPDTRFIFMHICYPYYEDLLAIVKQYTNAHVDMCWSWIINPVAATDYLKKHIVTAPANKLLVFGGDYIPVEPVFGHALIARRGIARALSQLVSDELLSGDDALALVEPLLRGNANRIFDLTSKRKVLASVDWAKR